MNIYFEDGLYPIIRLKAGAIYDLTKIINSSARLNDYYSESKHKVIFTYGNVRGIERVLAEDNKKLKFLYFDFSADNSGILNIIDGFMHELVHNQRSDIVVIPMPCIEYYILKAKGKQFSDLGRYRDTRVYENNVTKRNPSYEKYCKAELAQYSEEFPRIIEVNLYVKDIPFTNELYQQIELFVPPKEDFYASVPPIDILKEKYDKFLNQLQLYQSLGYVNYDAKRLIQNIHDYLNLLSSYDWSKSVSQIQQSNFFK